MKSSSREYLGPDQPSTKNEDASSQDASSQDDFYNPGLGRAFWSGLWSGLKGQSMTGEQWLSYLQDPNHRTNWLHRTKLDPWFRTNVFPRGFGRKRKRDLMAEIRRAINSRG